MERKIGEIFEYNGEWYQCVEGRCRDCYFSEKRYLCKQFITKNFCTPGIIFKKLEKVGEPVTERGRTFQRLNALKTECTGCVFLDSERGCDKDHYIDGPCFNREIWGEIKQNKEGMEEKKQKLDDLVGLYTSAKITYKEFDEKLKTLYADKEECKSSLKEFDINLAKAGKPVCTRDGRKARIICFDRIDNTGCNLTIVALIQVDETEVLQLYHDDGKCDIKADLDLMMLPEKKSGWVNVYKNQIHNTFESAEEGHKGTTDYIKTIKVEWEE